MRHRDPLLCTQSALGLYLFYRWHCSGEKAPTFRSRKDWYRVKLLVANDNTVEMSWQQQYDDIIHVFRELGIATDKITHAPRKSGPQSAEMHGVSENQVCGQIAIATRTTTRAMGLIRNRSPEQDAGKGTQ